MTKPKVSILIAVKYLNGNLKQCISKCLELDYPDYEIIVLPDEEISLSYPKTKVVPTGNKKPGIKRDIGAQHAEGEILAFIDDDAYPDKDWLSNAIVNFEDEDIAAVGGPAVTAKEDSLRKKASGLVYESPLVSGPYFYRYKKGKKSSITEFPSCNLLVRKDIFKEIGGFESYYWPGEDTQFCIKIVYDLKKKIIYDPKVLVYHHRRPLFGPHLKQIANYAFHRGYLIKKYPIQLRQLSYFVPSIFVISIVFGIILSPVSSLISTFLSILLIVYALTVLLFSFSKNFRIFTLTFAGTVLSHATYGLYFIQGLLKKDIR
jgi:GT2 family glycosyltransferase